MKSYVIDNNKRPIQIIRPGETDPSFYVNSMKEAFKVIDLDIALTEEAGYDEPICSASPSPDTPAPVL